jgi:hypothetical protein
MDGLDRTVETESVVPSVIEHGAVMRGLTAVKVVGHSVMQCGPQVSGSRSSSRAGRPAESFGLGDLDPDRLDRIGLGAGRCDPDPGSISTEWSTP